MRRTMTDALALWLVVIGLLAFAPAVAAGGSMLAGTWVSIDTDGSTQTMAIGQGATPPVTFQDFYASSCEGAGAQSTHFVASGTAWIDEGGMWVEYRDGGCGWRKIGPFGIGYAYDAGSDTLTDDFGVTWTRSR